MPWTKTDYPNSMKNLLAAVRNKAIEIANALLEERPKPGPESFLTGKIPVQQAVQIIE
jgi:hypothetical protein